jgi:hypothetical protein
VAALSTSEIMRFFAYVFVALLTEAAVAPRLASASNVEEFLLKVTLIDPAATFDIQTRIVPERDFEFSEMRGGAKITIKGNLGSKRKATYHLRLTLIEWASEKSNSTENYELDLVPGKMQGRGFISSFVFQRNILLTRIPAE